MELITMNRFQSITDADNISQKKLRSYPADIVNFAKEVLIKAKEIFFRRQCYLRVDKRIYVIVLRTIPSDSLVNEFDKFEEWLKTHGVEKRRTTYGDYIYYIN